MQAILSQLYPNRITLYHAQQETELCLINRETLMQYHALDRQSFHQLCSDLFKPLSTWYPNFTQWFNTTVLSGLEDGSREIGVSLSDQDITGYLILKNTPTEKKICTLYQKSEYRLKSTGSQLVNIAKLRLLTNHPIITVSEDNINQYQSFLSKHGFKLTQTINDLYINGKAEYIFQ